MSVGQVNHSPSYHTDAELDRDVKESLLKDTFAILNLTRCDKRRVLEEDRQRVRERLMQAITVKSHHLPDVWVTYFCVKGSWPFLFICKLIYYLISILFLCFHNPDSAPKGHLQVCTNTSLVCMFTTGLSEVFAQTWRCPWGQNPDLENTEKRIEIS